HQVEEGAVEAYGAQDVGEWVHGCTTLNTGTRTASGFTDDLASRDYIRHAAPAADARSGSADSLSFGNSRVRCSVVREGSDSAIDPQQGDIHGKRTYDVSAGCSY